MRTNDQEGRALAFEFSSKTLIANDAIRRSEDCNNRHIPSLAMFLKWLGLL
jgi:hypothetical protein